MLGVIRIVVLKKLGTSHLSSARPLLEYAAAVWDPYTVKDIHRLEGVQRHAARFVMNDYCRSTSVSNLIDELDWLPLSQRRKNCRLMVFEGTEWSHRYFC